LLLSLDALFSGEPELGPLGVVGDSQAGALVGDHEPCAELGALARAVAAVELTKHPCVVASPELQHERAAVLSRPEALGVEHPELCRSAGGVLVRGGDVVLARGALAHDFDRDSWRQMISLPRADARGLFSLGRRRNVHSHVRVDAHFEALLVPAQREVAGDKRVEVCARDPRFQDVLEQIDDRVVQRGLGHVLLLQLPPGVSVGDLVGDEHLLRVRVAHQCGSVARSGAAMSALRLPLRASFGDDARHVEAWMVARGSGGDGGERVLAVSAREPGADRDGGVRWPLERIRCGGRRDERERLVRGGVDRGDGLSGAHARDRAVGRDALDGHDGAIGLRSRGGDGRGLEPRGVRDRRGVQLARARRGVSSVERHRMDADRLRRSWRRGEPLGGASARAEQRLVRDGQRVCLLERHGVSPRPADLGHPAAPRLRCAQRDGRVRAHDRPVHDQQLGLASLQRRRVVGRHRGGRARLELSRRVGQRDDVALDRRGTGALERRWRSRRSDQRQRSPGLDAARPERRQLLRRARELRAAVLRPQQHAVPRGVLVLDLTRDSDGRARLAQGSGRLFSHQRRALLRVAPRLVARASELRVIAH
jgi:hypothetical protein